MKQIALYGAGGLGREVAAVLNTLTYCNPEGWELVGFFDDGRTKGEMVGHYGPVLGGMADLNAWPTPLCVALCFGSARTLEVVSGKITNPLVEFPNLVSKDLFVADSETFKLGRGNIIHGCCVFTTDVTIGSFNLFNGTVTVGHNTQIGDYNVFMPGCRISGDVTMSNGCLIGTMAFVKQGLRIPDGVTLSPLSPLLTNPKAHNTYVGNPARLFKF